MLRLLTLIAVLMSILAEPGLAAAQEATPAASPVSAANAVELPALAITLQDLADAGYPAATIAGSDLRLAPGAYAAIYTYAAIEKGRYGKALEEAGFRGGHVMYWQVVDPDSGEVQREIATYVEAYADAAGAEAGFDAAEALYLAETSKREIVTGTRTIGDRSAIFRDIDDQESATPTLDANDVPRSITLLFRVGDLDAGVDVVDYDRNLPPVTDLETLADAVRNRIVTERDQETPGLAFQALRVSPSTTSLDGYENLHGQLIPRSNESPEQRQFRETIWGGEEDVYRSATFVSAGAEGYDDDVLVQNALTQFENEDAAAEYLSAVPQLLNGSPDYSDLDISPSDAGDEAVTAAYTIQGSNGQVFHVERTIARKGSMVTDVAIRSVDGSPSAGALAALVTASLECLGGESWCPPAPVPAGLVA